MRLRHRRPSRTDDGGGGGGRHDADDEDFLRLRLCTHRVTVTHECEGVHRSSTMLLGVRWMMILMIDEEQ
jgi:hypothetical protein